MNTHHLPSTLILAYYNTGWVPISAVWPHTHIIKLDSRDYLLMLKTLSKITVFIRYTAC